MIKIIEIWRAEPQSEIDAVGMTGVAIEYSSLSTLVRDLANSSSGSEKPRSANLPIETYEAASPSCL